MNGSAETRKNLLSVFATHICHHLFSQAGQCLIRTPEYRSGGLMRNFENQAFRFGQNLQKFYIFVRMASGVQEKVQNLFGWAHQASKCLNLSSKIAKFVWPPTRSAST